MALDLENKKGKRKNDRKFDYFEAFVSQAEIAEREAKFVVDVMANYDGSKLDKALEEAHAIENEGDAIVRELIAATERDFVTPIERPDLIELAFALDNVTDGFEKILRNLYMYNAEGITVYANEMCSLLWEECQLMRKGIGNFRNFKKPHKLQERAHEIDKIEGKVDELYLKAMRELFTAKKKDAEYKIKWRALYASIEDCSDAIEQVSDLADRIIASNI